MTFTAIDLETTGTLPYVDRIVEIAAVRFRGGQIISTFQSLVDPKVEIPQEVTNINGINNDMVRSKPLIQEVLEPFSKFCGSDVLVAHNATFDFQFLKSAIEKFKTQAPAGPLLDTYSLAKKALPGMMNYKLATLVRYLKLDFEKLHRAEQDASCCGHLFFHLIQKLEIENWKKLADVSGRQPLRFPQLAHTFRQLDLL